MHITYKLYNYVIVHMYNISKVEYSSSCVFVILTNNRCKFLDLISLNQSDAIIMFYTKPGSISLLMNGII